MDLANIVGAATGVLDEATLLAVTAGFESLSATVTQVIAVSVGGIVGVIALTGGVNYALRKIRSVLGWAS